MPDTEDEGAGATQSLLAAFVAMKIRQQVAQTAMKTELQGGQAEMGHAVYDVQLQLLSWKEELKWST